MRFDAIERHGTHDAPLQRVDARIKLIAAFLFVVTVVSTPVGWWRFLVAEGLLLAFLIGLSGVPPVELAKRWLGFLVLFGFLTMTVAPSRPERVQYGLGVVALTLLVKDSLAFLGTLLLAHVTPFHKILRALKQLGVPLTLVATLNFMYRYLFVLTEELDRMVQARRARTFRRSGRLDWGILTGLIGVLFLRSFERSERVHAAMLSRGWDGTLRTLDESP